MQTSVQKEDSVRFGSGVCEVNAGAGWVNIGMITGATLTITKIIKQFIGSNAKMPPKSKNSVVNFAFNLFELDLTFLNLINGDFDLTNTAGTPVAVTAEAHGTGWTIGTPIQLDHKNGANTVVGSIVVKGAGTPLVLNTDYRVYVGDGENGILGYTYITPILANATAITVDYSYTPNASKTGEFGDSDRTLALSGFRFTHTYDTGKIFQIEFFEAYNAQGITIAFTDDEGTDPTSTPVTITAFPDSTKTGNKNLFKIYDENSLT